MSPSDHRDIDRVLDLKRATKTLEILHEFDVKLAMEFRKKELAPETGIMTSPIFYVLVNPEPDPATLTSLPMLGHWHLTISRRPLRPHKIAAAKNQQVEADDFPRAAVDGAMKVLS
jgi:hypothetical protein